MEAATLLQLQQAEVETVLQSGLFAKAPRLREFFQYICERHFAGESELIKEYSIALEALGRSSDFDPKQDSIVRVEAHRLRKRLEEYYRGPGAVHQIHISIPNGQYRPRFTLRENAAEVQIAPEPAPVDPGERSEAPPSPPVLLHKNWIWLSLLAVACGGLLGAFLLTGPRTKGASRQPTPEVWRGKWSEPADSAEFRMLAGYHGQPFLDRQGHTWAPDAFYAGGTSSSIPPERLAAVQSDAQFIKAERSGQFQYDIPLRQTTYEVHLYLLETEYLRGSPKGLDGTRAFQLSVNGEVKFKLMDPLTAAGAPNRLYERVLKDVRPQADGRLRLGFAPFTGPAFLNAIAILPSPPGRIHPIRIVAQNSPVTDSDGRLWAADEYFAGGNAVCRKSVVGNSQDALYQGERYGNFSYRIPVAPGKYRLTLHFAETWFGTPDSHQPALDSRIFNVFANGVALLRDYQIIKDAGESNRGVQKVFENLQPDAQGLLVIEFAPVENYAEVNAIEVVETG